MLQIPSLTSLSLSLLDANSQDFQDFLKETSSSSGTILPDADVTDKIDDEDVALGPQSVSVEKVLGDQETEDPIKFGSRGVLGDDPKADSGDDPNSKSKKEDEGTKKQNGGDE